MCKILPGQSAENRTPQTILGVWCALRDPITLADACKETIRPLFDRIALKLFVVFCFKSLKQVHHKFWLIVMPPLFYKSVFSNQCLELRLSYQ